VPGPQVVDGSRDRRRAVGDVEKGDLRALCLALCVCVLADADQMGPLDWVEVGRVAAQEQLTGDPRSCRVRQVEGVERIGLPERHHITGWARETHRVDLLTLA